MSTVVMYTVTYRLHTEHFQIDQSPLNTGTGSRNSHMYMYNVKLVNGVVDPDSFFTDLDLDSEVDSGSGCLP